MPGTSSELPPEVERAVERAAASVDGSRRELFQAFATRLSRGVEIHQVGGPEAFATSLNEAFAWCDRREPGAIELRVRNPEHRPGRTVVEVLQEDRPFIVDSLHLALGRLGLQERLVLHPILSVRRDADGRLVAVTDEVEAPLRESYVDVEIAPAIEDPERLAALEETLRQTLDWVRDVTDDHRRMIRTVRELIAGLEYAAPFLPGGAERVARVQRFLGWIAEGRFVFVGLRRYRLERGSDGTPEAQIQPGTGLGMWRDDASSRLSRPLRGDEIPQDIREDFEDPRILLISKSYMESRIHRPGRLDRILVKEYDDQGRVTGFTILVGLYTLPVLRTPGSQIPLLAERLKQVVERMGVTFGSHEHKAVVAAFDSAPVELLFSADVDQLVDLLRELVADAGAHSVQVVLRRRPHGRAFYIAVLLPREHYREDLRGEIRALLERETGAAYIDDRTTFVDERTAVVHCFCTAREGHRLEPDAVPLEREVRALCSPWADRLLEALRARGDQERAETLASRYGEAFPAALRLRTDPADAVRDVEALEALRETGRPQFAFYFGVGDAERATATLRMYLDEAPLLSDVLPAIDRYGIRVVDAQLSRVRLPDRREAVIESLRILPLGADQNDLDALAPRLADALAATFSRAASSDSLDGLVLGAGLDWRQVDLVRAYLEYFTQIQGSLSRPFLRKVLLENPLAVRMLVRFFEARHDPEQPESERAARAEEAARRFEGYRDRISSLNEDRALSGFFNLVEATLRTNHFAQRREPHRVVLKLDSRRIRELSGMVPHREIFVHSADLMGIHLRGGPVARGGLRWSDRQDDLRVEILGLMSTQMLKNGLIVPVGAKGGFVLRRNGLSPQQARAEADAQYRVFIASLLDVTDNLAPDGTVVGPPGVRRPDGDDPYLVVAADKGTAHLSDTANAIAIARDFWLGDAFASGGSEGYDHKKYGITARGAWECVRHHFGEIGIDPDRDAFTVAGIGDMSGDVFGNGLLLMPRARLLAAFDHRHIFLDPDPDSEVAWKERRRLFELQRSSWADYRAECLSVGGGVWPRESKRVPIPEAMRELLGLGEHASGEALVRAILAMSVDLLWNGGIGTYVKSSGESHADVGDRANDSVRIDAHQLRARVVGEGGNLGLTQAARVEAALAGVRLDTDAIHNSAGVDLSDHEVNYKIALAPLVRAGALDADARRDALFRVAEDACQSVLAHNRSQALALSLDELRSARDRPIFLRAIEDLCAAAQLDPAELDLPDAAVVADRPPEVGLTRPELAVLLGLAKLHAQHELSASDVPARQSVVPLYRHYFPPLFRERFGEALDDHRLRQEIGALCLVNRLVDAGGATLMTALTSELGVPLPTAASALLTAEELMGIPEIRRRLIDRAGTGREGVYGALLEVDAGVRDVAHYLVRCAATDPDSERLARWRAGAERLRVSLRDYLSAGELQLLDARCERLQRVGLPEELALDVASLPLGDRGLNILRVCEETGVEPLEAARSYARLGDGSGINWVYGRLAQAEVGSMWDRMVLVDLRGALLDLQRVLTEQVLKRADGDPEAAVQVFLEEHRDAIEGVRALQRRAATEAGASALAVIAARLRDLHPEVASASPPRG